MANLLNKDIWQTARFAICLVNYLDFFGFGCL